MKLVVLIIIFFNLVNSTTLNKSSSQGEKLQKAIKLIKEKKILIMLIIYY